MLKDSLVIVSYEKQQVPGYLNKVFKKVFEEDDDALNFISTFNKDENILKKVVMVNLEEEEVLPMQVVFEGNLKLVYK